MELPETRCQECREVVGLVDEHGRCEECVMAASQRVSVLWEIEGYVLEGAKARLTDEQIKEAVAMALDDTSGKLCGDWIERTEDGWPWPVDSLFLARDRDEPEPNPIRHLRTLSCVTLDALAAELEVEPSQVALWEQGAPIPDYASERMSEFFGVKPAYIEGSI